MEAMTAPDLHLRRQQRRAPEPAQFIDGWMDPGTRYEPIEVTDRYFLPLGPDAGVAGDDPAGPTAIRARPRCRLSAATWCCAAPRQPLRGRIRFSDTFRRIGGQWRAVHIQATRVPEPATAP